ncbi:hypothetical protein AMTRI_Chr10g4060 [Amborella trichopoda]
MRGNHRLLPYRKAVFTSKIKPPNESDGSDWPKELVIVIDGEEEEKVMGPSIVGSHVAVGESSNLTQWRNEEVIEHAIPLRMVPATDGDQTEHDQVVLMLEGMKVQSLSTTESIVEAIKALPCSDHQVSTLKKQSDKKEVLSASQESTLKKQSDKEEVSVPVPSGKQGTKKRVVVSASGEVRKSWVVHMALYLLVYMLLGAALLFPNDKSVILEY